LICVNYTYLKFGAKKIESKTMDFEDLSYQVIGCAIEVHKNLGPGLLESRYEKCLAYELSLRQILYKQQPPLPIR